MIVMLLGAKSATAETTSQRNEWYEENESETYASDARRGSEKQEEGKQVEPTNGERTEGKPKEGHSVEANERREKAKRSHVEKEESRGKGRPYGTLWISHVQLIHIVKYAAWKMRIRSFF